jgi:hypothetical protein
LAKRPVATSALGPFGQAAKTSPCGKSRNAPAAWQDGFGKTGSARRLWQYGAGKTVLSKRRSEPEIESGDEQQRQDAEQLEGEKSYEGNRQAHVGAFVFGEGAQTT